MFATTTEPPPANQHQGSDILQDFSHQLIQVHFPVQDPVPSFSRKFFLLREVGTYPFSCVKRSLSSLSVLVKRTEERAATETIGARGAHSFQDQSAIRTDMLVSSPTTGKSSTEESSKR